MKSLNLQKMIEDSVTTGEPVTESAMLGCESACNNDPPLAVIGIEN
jgi:hypothetical protein